MQHPCSKRVDVEQMPARVEQEDDVRQRLGQYPVPLLALPPRLLGLLLPGDVAKDDDGLERILFAGPEPGDGKDVKPAVPAFPGVEDAEGLSLRYAGREGRHMREPVPRVPGAVLTD